MTYKILAVKVEFEIDAQQHTDGQFTVPKEVCGILGMEPGDRIALTIQGASTLPYSTVTTLRSGTEIYGPDMRDRIRAGERLHVTAWKP